jgi:hypothetical protein
VGKSIGVTVGYGEAVAEGNGLDVAVTVGDAGTTCPNPPHPRRNKTSADIPMKSFFVIGS